jgi:hypothetical protein
LGRISRVHLEIEEGNVSVNKPKKATAFWVDPNKKIHKLKPSENHLDWIYKRLSGERHTLEPEPEDNFDAKVIVYNDAKAVGWIRGYLTPNNGWLSLESDKRLSKQECLDIAFDVDPTVQLYKCHVDLANSYYVINFAIDEALLEGAIRPWYAAYWIDPKGKVYQLPSDVEHEAWMAEKMSQRAKGKIAGYKGVGRRYIAKALKEGWIRAAVIRGKVVNLESQNKLSKQACIDLAFDIDPTMEWETIELDYMGGADTFYADGDGGYAESISESLLAEIGMSLGMFFTTRIDSWWVEPNGTAHELEDQTHEQFAGDLLGIDIEADDYDPEELHASQQLIDKGWLRCAYDHREDTLYIQSKRPQSKQACTNLAFDLLKEGFDHSLEVVNEWGFLTQISGRRGFNIGPDNA